MGLLLWSYLGQQVAALFVYTSVHHSSDTMQGYFAATAAIYYLVVY